MSIRTARHTSARLGAVALASSALLLAGCAGEEPATSTAESSTTSTEPGASEPSESGAGEDVSAEHNDADTRFAQSMVPHHRQAVQMSDVLLAKEGVDERVLTLAREIEAAQQPEIDQMLGFLQTWQEEIPAETTGMGGGMDGSDDMGTEDMGTEDMGTEDMGTEDMGTDDGGTDDMGTDDEMSGGMNGMMSGEEMQRLDDAEGVEAARLFLEQMTRHHEGAVQMAQAELEAGQNPQALELAQAIVDAQEAEIAEMQEILATL